METFISFIFLPLLISLMILFFYLKEQLKKKYPTLYKKLSAIANGVLFCLTVYLLIKMDFIHVMSSGIHKMTPVDISIVLSVIVCLCVFYFIVWKKQKNKK